jgi:hypothetical protein
MGTGKTSTSSLDFGAYGKKVGTSRGILAWARQGAAPLLGAELRFHPLPTYRSSKRANNSGPDESHASLWTLLTCRQKGDIMKKIVVIFALAIAFTTGMAVVTVVAAIA